MAARRRGITADELIRQLEADPEFQKQQAARESEQARIQAEYEREEEPILVQLRQIGVQTPSLYDLVRTHGPLTREVVDVLRANLANVKQYLVQEAIVRALGGTHVRYPGGELVALFDTTSSDELRWVIANTLAESKAEVSDDWLANRLRDRNLDLGRQMLPLALARRMTPDFAIPILRKVFDQLPGFVAMAFAEIGGPEEIALMSQNRSGQKTWIRKEFDNAIRRIERRTKKNRNAH